MNLDGKIQYQVYKEHLENGDTGPRTAYGLAVYTDSSVQPVLRVSDISVERGFVEEFAALCDKAQVTPEHVLEVLEDFWGIHAI